MLLVTLFFTWHPIETTIENNANQLLAKQDENADHDWAKIYSFNRGRNVLLTGTAPNEDSVEKVKQIVLSSAGINSVTFVGSINTPNPAQLIISFNNKQIVLTGTVNGQDAIDNIVLTAIASYKPRIIINNLTVFGGVDDLPITPSLISSIADLEVGAQVTIQRNKVILLGKIENDARLLSLLKNLKSVFKGNIDNQLSTIEPALQCLKKIKEILEAKKINFSSGEATLTNNSYPALTKIIKTMRICPDTNFEISGHTDSTGSPNFNLELSESRAKAVLDHLIENGLDEKRFTVRGYGDSQMISENQSLLDQAANRRIEFKVIN